MTIGPGLSRALPAGHLLIGRRRPLDRRTVLVEFADRHDGSRRPMRADRRGAAGDDIQAGSSGALRSVGHFHFSANGHDDDDLLIRI